MPRKQVLDPKYFLTGGVDRSSGIELDNLANNIRESPDVLAALRLVGRQTDLGQALRDTSRRYEIFAEDTLLHTGTDAAGTRHYNIRIRFNGNDSGSIHLYTDGSYSRMVGGQNFYYFLKGRKLHRFEQGILNRLVEKSSQWYNSQMLADKFKSSIIY